MHSPSGFWRRREVLDAISLLKFLVHPHDNLSLLTLFRSPYFRVPDQQLAAWMSTRPDSLWTRIREVKDDAIVRLRDLIAVRRARGLISAFEQGVCESGMLDLAIQADPSGRREANLWKLISRVREEEMRPGFQTLELVEEVDGWMSDDESDEGDAKTAREPNCIHLMTIHGSKGLEFHHVIVPRMGTSPRLTYFDIFSHHEDRSMFSFPVFVHTEGKSVTSPLDKLRNARKRERELHEQDRWLYVALTRAKESLALCWSDERLESNSWAARGSLITADRFSCSGKWRDQEVARPPFAVASFAVKEAAAMSVRGEWVGDDTTVTVTGVTSVSKLSAKVARASIAGLAARQSGAAFGSHLHRVFQMLKSRPDPGWVGETNPELQSLIDFVWSQDEPSLREIISNGEVEWGFRCPFR